MIRTILLLLALAATGLAEISLGQVIAEALSFEAPAIAISPSGRMVLVQDASGAVWLRQIGQQLGKRIGKPDVLRAVFTWSPDDKFFFVTRNGRAGEFEAPSGKVRGLLTGSGALSQMDASPNGQFVAFIRGNNLWVMDTADKKQRPLTTFGGENLLVGFPDATYAHEFDVTRHYWWAPNSSTIAFIETDFKTSDHYVLPGGTLPMFRLKTVDVATGKLTTIAESSEKWPYLSRVAWHPDGKSMVFYRMNRLQMIAELCLFDNGAVKTILSEKDSYWVNVPETPVFLSGGKQMVVSSERSGAKHVYLHNLDGELVKDLTPGDLEVYRLHAAVDGKGGVLVSGSKGTKQEQQLYRIDTESGEVKQVSSEAGWHEVSMNAAGNAYVDTYSSTEHSPVYWWHVDGRDASDIYHATVTQKPAATEFLSIKTHDNIGLAARLFKPDDFDTQKKYPVILYTFSGPRGRVVEDSWGGWQMAWNRYMVSRGYLVLAVDVRGSGGYGHLFEEYIHYRFGAQEVADLREVVSYLKRQSYVDGNRLGIWGCDYGANTVVHAMLQFPGGFKAGFADSPITVWTKYDGYFTERYLGLPQQRVNEYDDSGALQDAHRMTGGLLVAASDKNPLIRGEQVDELHKAMLTVKKHKEVIERLHLINLANVDYREHPDELAKLLTQVTEFFEKTL